MSQQVTSGEQLRHAVVDSGVIAGLTVVALVGFRTSYGGYAYLVVGLLGTLLGLAVAWLTSWRRMPAGALALGLIVAAFTFGGLVLPQTALAGVVPTVATAAQLVNAGIRGWAALLSVLPPIGSAYQLLAVPYLAALVTAGVAVGFALRSRWWPPMALPPVVLLVLTILFGTQTPALPAAQGALFAVVLIVWRAQVSARSRVVRDAGPRRRPWLAAGLAVAAVAVGVLAGPVLPGADARERFVLRDSTTPPFDPKAYASPLGRIRKYLTTQRDTELLKVSGVPAGTRIRVAAMDTYDGLVYSVAGGSDGDEASGWFQKIGATVSDDQSRGAAVRFNVEVKGYEGVWVPDVGSLNSISFGGRRADELAETFRYNLVTKTAATPAGLRKGDKYTIEAMLARDVRLADLTGDLSVDELPQPTSVPEELTAFSGDVAAEADARIERVRAIQAALAEGYYSSGGDGEAPSLPGHGAGRLATMFREPALLGNEEQYAAAMALALRRVQIPARAVVGFVTSQSRPEQIRGTDASAWVEIRTADGVWVPVSAAPDRDRRLTDQTPKPKPRKRTMDQPLPPPPVSVPDKEVLASQVQPPPPPPPPPPGLPGWLKVATGGIAALALLMSPLMIVALRKRRRRRLRRRAPEPSAQVAGSWWEIGDLATDLGRPLPFYATRRQGAALLGVPSAVALAHRTDELVFSGDPINPDDVEEVWGTSLLVEQELLAGTNRRTRWRARINPSSLSWRVRGWRRRS